MYELKSRSTYDKLKTLFRQVSSFLIDLLSAEVLILNLSASNIDLNDLLMINWSYSE